MKTSAEWSPDAGTAILCVGDPGSGKTRLMMSMPDPGILDCDMNLRSAVRVSGGKPFLFAQPAIDDSGKEVPEDRRWERAVDEMRKLISDTRVKSVCVDGLTNLCQWGLMYAERKCVEAGINIKKEYLAKYQGFIPLLSNFITMLRIGGKYVFVTCHQTMERDEATGVFRYSLAIPGQLKDRLGGLFTDVWGASVTSDPTNAKVGARYEIRTKPSGYHITLKTSLDLEPAINVTDKNPSQIWDILAPKLAINASTKKN